MRDGRKRSVIRSFPGRRFFLLKFFIKFFFFIIALSDTLFPWKENVFFCISRSFFLVFIFINFIF